MPHGIKGPVPLANQPVFGVPVVRIMIEQDAAGNIKTSFSRPLSGPQAIKIFAMALTGQADWLLQQSSLLINPNRKEEPEQVPGQGQSEQKVNGNDKTEA